MSCRRANASYHESKAMRKKLILIGAICLLLVAALLVGVGIFFLNARKSAARVRSVAASSSFANVPESAIPGRYKYISGDKENFIVLYEDHTFLDKDGHILPTHRWKLARTLW